MRNEALCPLKTSEQKHRDDLLSLAHPTVGSPTANMATCQQSFLISCFLEFYVHIALPTKCQHFTGVRWCSRHHTSYRARTSAAATTYAADNCLAIRSGRSCPRAHKEVSRVNVSQQSPRQVWERFTLFTSFRWMDVNYRRKLLNVGDAEDCANSSDSPATVPVTPARGASSIPATSCRRVDVLPFLSRLLPSQERFSVLSRDVKHQVCQTITGQRRNALVPKWTPNLPHSESPQTSCGSCPNIHQLICLQVLDVYRLDLMFSHSIGIGFCIDALRSARSIRK